MLFKSSYGTEKYLLHNIPYRYRSSFVKFRCGVAPLWFETGRFECKIIDKRICFICNNCVEDEKHVLLSCPLYTDLGLNLYNDLSKLDAYFN